MQDRKRMFFGYKNATLDSDIIEELTATYQEPFILAPDSHHVQCTWFPFQKDFHESFAYTFIDSIQFE